MKTILFFALALIASGHVSAHGVAPKSPNGISIMKSGQVIKLFYRGEQAGKVKITIYNHEGIVVFRETMQNREHFMRPYNFSSLPEGEYSFEVNDAQGKRSQTVTYSLSSTKKIAHLSRLYRLQNKYILAVPNRGPNALTVKIFDERNTLVYQDTEEIDGNFAKVYNLNDVEGDHTFEIIDKNGKISRLTKPSQE